MKSDERSTSVIKPRRKKRYWTGLREMHTTVKHLALLYEKSEREEKRRAAQKRREIYGATRKIGDRRFYRAYIERLIENLPVLQAVVSRASNVAVSALQDIINERIRKRRTYKWLVRAYINSIDPLYAKKFVKKTALQLNKITIIQLKLYREFLKLYKDLHRDMYLGNDVLLLYAIEYFESLFKNKDVRRVQFEKYMREGVTMTFHNGRSRGKISPRVFDRLLESYLSISRKAPRTTLRGDMQVYLEYILHVVIDDVKYAQDKGEYNILWKEHKKVEKKVRAIHAAITNDIEALRTATIQDRILIPHATANECSTMQPLEDVQPDIK